MNRAGCLSMAFSCRRLSPARPEDLYLPLKPILRYRLPGGLVQGGLVVEALQQAYRESRLEEFVEAIVGQEVDRGRIVRIDTMSEQEGPEIQDLPVQPWFYGD